MKNAINKIFSVLVSLFLFLFGNFDILLKTILLLMFLDYITGVCKAFVKNKVNSSIGAKGIVRKVGYLSVIAISVLLDRILNIDGGLRTLVITTFIFNEIISILENSSEMGVKIPKILYQSLEKLETENKKNNF